jgi:large subunit ribosomal protein L10
MPKIEQKQVVVDEIKQKLEKAVSVVIMDARGLSVEQDTSLRKLLREAGIEYKVYKNTMMNFAIKGTSFEGMSEYLSGPSTFAICYGDSTLAARIISKQLKTMPALEFKAGVIEGKVYDAAAIKLISEIPAKEELYSKLLGSFKNPMSGFARVIKAISEKKSEEIA